MKSESKFKCTLMKQESGSFKLIKWNQPNYNKIKDPSHQLSFGDIEVFEPKLISIRRLNKSLVTTIKSTCGRVRFGFASQDWIFWYLTQMRNKSIIHLMVQNEKFSNGYTVNQGNFGPSCTNFAQHPTYTARCIRTYLDNEKNFFFA